MDWAQAKLAYAMGLPVESRISDDYTPRTWYLIRSSNVFEYHALYQPKNREYRLKPQDPDVSGG